MASGSFGLTRTGSTSSYVSFSVNWSSSSNGSSANSSTLHVAVYIQKSRSSTSNTWGTSNTSVSVTNAGTQYENGLGFSVAPGGSTLLFAKNFTVPHNSDGKKSVTISVNVGGDVAWGNGSATANLDNIPRQANISSAPNFNDEENPTITYSNPAGNAVNGLHACISLTGATDDIKYRDISKTGSSYTFNLTETERNVLRNACTGSNSRTVQFFVRTVIGGNTYYSSLSRTLTIVNANPTLSPIIEDTNETVLALTGDSNKLVKYFSNPNVSTGVVSKKGASISENKITNGNNISTSTGVSTFYNVIDPIFSFYAKDSRGNSASQTINKNDEGNWIDYVKLTCNTTPSNPTINGNMLLNVSGNYWNGSFGLVENYLTLKYRMAVKGEDLGEWIEVIPTIVDNTYSIDILFEGLDYQTNYSFEVLASDKLDVTPLRSFDVQTTPVFDWGKNDFRVNTDLNVVGEIIKNDGYYKAFRGYTEDVNTALIHGYYNTNDETANLPSITNNKCGILEVIESRGKNWEVSDGSSWIWQIFKNTGGEEYRRYGENSESMCRWYRASDGLIYDVTLTSEASNMNVDGLDMVADGGEYEFTLFHSETGKNGEDVHIRFNNITTGYHQIWDAVANTATAEASLIRYAEYRQNVNRIYGHTNSSVFKEFPARMDGKFYMVKNPYKVTIGYELVNKLAVQGLQKYSHITGVSSLNINNITSLQFWKEDNLKLAPGSRLMIRRTNR